MIVTLAILSKQHVNRRTLIPTPKHALNSSILLTSCTGFRTSSSGSWRRFIEEEKISNFGSFVTKVQLHLYVTPTWRWRIYKYVFPLVSSGSGSIKQGRQERNTLATPPADWMWLNTLVCFCQLSIEPSRCIEYKYKFHSHQQPIQR